MYWNCRILICVETWLTARKLTRFPGFTCLRKDRPHARGGGGGILFLIRKNLTFCEINNIASPDVSVELCCIKINNVDPQIDTIACYRPPGHSLTHDQWNNIILNVNNDNNCILVGNFNAHHISWN